MNNAQKPTSVTQIYNALAEPFSWEEIEIMPAALSRAGDKAQALAYFDARAVMNRLDAVLGFSNWELTDVEYFTAGGKNGCRGKLTVRIWDGDHCITVSRTEVAELSDIEAVKGGLSNVLKRCFSALANRTLYSVDFGWQLCDTYESGGKKKFSKFKPASLAQMKAIYERSVKEASKRLEPVVIGEGEVPEEEKPPANLEPKVRNLAKAPEPAKEEPVKPAAAVTDKEAEEILAYLRKIEAANQDVARSLAEEYAEKKMEASTLTFRQYLLAVSRTENPPTTIAELRDTFGDPFYLE